jgi:mono/diheme cytochrome c family protein/glucose/arabinose dehydrogenase
MSIWEAPMESGHLSRVLIAAAATLLAVGVTMAQGPAPSTTQGNGPAAPEPPAQGGRGARGAGGGRGGADLTFKGPVLPLSPAEQARRFWLPQGYRIEAVVTEPHVQEPGQIAFDGNGRMFVVELRGYMQDLDATGQLDPSGRISIHEDKDNDGLYETHGVFVDELVLPRWVMPFGVNAVLTNESNADEVWKFTDTNNDGKADKKELFATGFGRLTNVELQQSGLTWGLDNWMYSTVNQFRVRWTPNGMLREPTGKNGGQWGLTQDNYGKMWFQAGGSGMPAYFQLPVVYGAFAFPEEFEPGLTTIWGAPVLTGDFAGATNARYPDGSLINATAAAGNDVFRGDRLPKDVVGDYLYGETAGRVIRRLRPVNVEGMTQLRNVYPLSEFVKSTDPLFRPVDVTTAPDGTVYITDMYRGVIEELQWNQPGSYIRGRIQELQLEKVIRHGRIWRLSYEGMPRDTRQPRMLGETPSQLVGHLNHPNGWWRDTAQQLLVLKQDKSVAPALRKMALSPSNQLGRIHALWTLEGLDSLEATLVRTLMKDPDPQIRIQAVRASESLYKGGDRSFAPDYRALAEDPVNEVVMQALLTLNHLKVADTPALVTKTMAAIKTKGVQIVGAAILDPTTNQYVGRGAAANVGGGPAPFNAEEQIIMARGQTIYSETCFACHGDDGRGAVLPGAPAGTTRAPSLVGSARVLGHRDYVSHALLAGLTGPIDGQRYDETMIPMGANPDEWIADVGSFVRNSWGNRAPFVSPSDVARVRAASATRKASWTVEEIDARLPKPLVVTDQWKLSASHNTANARNALSLAPWTTGAPQQAGMWLQIELPQAARLAEIQFDSESASGRGGGRGRGAARGGRGGPAGGPAGQVPPQTGPAPVSLAPSSSPQSGGFQGTGGYPRGYQVQVSMDGTTWSAPVAEGKGAARSTAISFAPVQAKFVRITQTATVDNAPPWAVMLLRIYEAGPGVK